MHVEALICEAYIVEKDLNIYLILFRASLENKYQPYFKAWWRWRSVFEWELVIILPS